MRVLVVVLLLSAMSSAKAGAETALIVDVSGTSTDSSALHKLIHKDVLLAGYSQSNDAALRDAMVAPLPAAETWSFEEGQLEAAEKSYERFELKASIGHLESFDASWRNKSSSAKGQRLLSKRYLLGGLVRFAQGEKDKARDNFRLSHRLAPKITRLAASQYRPAVVKLYDEAVQANTTAGVAHLVQDWSPSSARLFVDGIASEPSTVLTGPHLLSLEAPGYTRASFVKFLTAETKLVAKLEKIGRVARLLELRRGALRADTTNLRALASATGVPTLVLFKHSDAGPLGAVYREVEGSLSPWVAIGSMRWRAALDRTPADSTELVASTPKRSRSWYKTWWGGGLLAAGGGAALGATLYLLFSPSDGDSATIDEWCFGSCEEQQ